MKSKAIIVKFGYNYYQFEGNYVNLLSTLTDLHAIEQKRVDGQYIYEPKEEDDERINVVFTNPTNIRKRTIEEKENAELKEALSSKTYYSDELTKAKNKIGELECKINVLQEGKESPK
jgi:hypothetical protein